MKRLLPVARAEALPQVLVLIIAVVLAVLVVASAQVYIAVGEAHALPSFVAIHQFEFHGLDAGGDLTANGSVVFTLSLTFHNPSPRTLILDLVGYKAWIEDGPMEARLPGLDRTDNALVNGSVVEQFFMAFFGSVAVSPLTVPANGNGTLTLTLSLAVDSPRFAAVQNITAFSVARGVSASAIPWNVWVLVSLAIEGVPPPASSSAADYLRDNARVSLQEGIDLGA